MNVVITGASRGIGRAMARFMVDQGHTVVAVARSVDLLSTLDEELADSDGRLIALAADITDGGGLNALELVLENEIDQVDVLINNAGTLKSAGFEELEMADWEHMYKVNVFGLVGVTRSVLPSMKGDWAHIVNISSMGGVMGSAKFSGLSAYASSKGAVSILTECLAEEYKETPIRVNGLALGACSTEMLAEAFPGYEAPIGPDELGAWIANFALESHKVMNGKIISLALTTP